MKTKIRYTIGLRGNHKHYSQSPLFMLSKQWYENGEVVFGKVLFEFDVEIPRKRLYNIRIYFAPKEGVNK